MIILDTNVVSETLRIDPEPKVLKWLAGFSADQIYLSVPTIMELWSGTLRLPQGRRHMELAKKIELISTSIYKGQILILDEIAAAKSGQFIADQFLRGMKPQIADCQIAAIAMTNSFAVATRDTKDFEHEGLTVINPWEKG